MSVQVLAQPQEEIKYSDSNIINNVSLKLSSCNKATCDRVCIFESE